MKGFALLVSMVVLAKCKRNGSAGHVALQRRVSCDVWNVQQLAAGGRWNTLMAENNQSDAERALERLAKSGERNLRIQVQRAANVPS